ncbi:exo-alpha-sialidase [Actinomadura logoneensis]|uniref:Exo-alpha-sialidase n=1 Tax=Actinomadura logoneensis TaxID=2293572 RepID=A0A372JSD5_9ACTN|nr:exo-alpha-sialidase [Actinomadura logoneensis]RFU42927.1 exo-alpha-sialidase [Actinomadura logoneensis]
MITKRNGAVGAAAGATALAGAVAAALALGGAGEKSAGVVAASDVGTRNAGTPNVGAADVARGTLLPVGPAWYPRAVRLAYSADRAHRGRILVSTNTNAGGTISESTDGGRTFHRLSAIRPPMASGRFSCCSTLFEYPQKLGRYRAGTLVWATSVNSLGGGETRPNPHSAILGWRSTDYGRTWRPLPRPIVSGTGGHGVWEPEFSAAGGGLVVHFSDKTQKKYGQALARVRSLDGGDSWSGKSQTVALGGTKDSPGMPVVRHYPGRGYAMVFEYCDTTPTAAGHGCRVYFRTSKDGWNWGDARKPGTLVRTVDGRELAHAPTLAWTKGGGSRGRLLLVARLVEWSPAKVDAKASGTTLLVNDAGGAGRWRTIASPVRLTNFRDARLTPEQRRLVLPCQNYSSSLLPSGDGRTLLEVATDVVGGTCKAFYARGPVR